MPDTSDLVGGAVALVGLAIVVWRLREQKKRRLKDALQRELDDLRNR